MKTLNLTPFLFLCFILNSCQSKPEIQHKINHNYTIQNYKLDDDEIERRKIADTIAKDTIVKKKEIDTLLIQK